MANQRCYLALDKVYPILNGTPNALHVWLSHDYSVALWKPRLDSWQSKIDELRKWTKSLGWLDRRAYNGWLNFFQKELDSAWSELRTKKETRKMDDYKRRSLKQDAAKRRFAENHFLPEPPVGRD
jgi:hypothetical protein